MPVRIDNPYTSLGPWARAASDDIIPPRLLGLSMHPSRTRDERLCSTVLRHDTGAPWRIAKNRFADSFVDIRQASLYDSYWRTRKSHGNGDRSESCAGSVESITGSRDPSSTPVWNLDTGRKTTRFIGPPSRYVAQSLVGWRSKRLIRPLVQRSANRCVTKYKESLWEALGAAMAAIGSDNSGPGCRSIGQRVGPGDELNKVKLEK